MKTARLLLAALALCAAAPAQKPDAVLRALREELSRSRALRIENLDPPYYIEYSLDDTESFSAGATLGGLISSRSQRLRFPRVQVRVGDYKFDNTNYVYSGFAPGARFEAEQLPLEDDTAAIRHAFWLMTDRAYKGAVESMAGKRAALRGVTQAESLNDFARATPARLVVDSPPVAANRPEWEARVRRLSALVSEYPRVFGSSVDFESIQSTSYFVNSEGSETKTPERLARFRVRAWSQSADGMTVRDAVEIFWPEPAPAVSEAELEKAVRATAQNVTALASAPPGEQYSGPVLIEGAAAAQLFAELLGRNLAATRRPVSIPGRPVPSRESELEGRLGARVLPEWMDAVDDPTQTEWRGRPLFGHFLVDMEGVTPQPVVLIESGILKTFLLTRQPVRGFDSSNGHARLPGVFGAKTATIGNLFIRARQAVPEADLKNRLLDLCRQRGRPYGLIVRKMDFPSSASGEELRRMAAAGRSGGNSRLVSAPLLVWRVTADGKEELVRGLRFRRLDTRSLKDILAAGEPSHVFEYLENGAPMALMGGGSFVTQAAVIAPSVLIDDLELELPSAEQPKLPLVPPPAAGR